MKKAGWIVKYNRAFSIVLSVSLLLASVVGTPRYALPLGIGKVEAASSTLKQKQQELERLKKLAAEKEAAAKKQAEVKAKADVKIKEVTGQITVLQGSIQKTQSNIQTTSVKISEKNQEIAQLESELRRIKDQQDVLLRQMYIMRTSLPDSLTVFSDQPISDREKEQAQFSALKKSVAALFVQTTAAKLAVEQNRDDLTKHSQELVTLKDQQDEQKKGLASYQQTQTALKLNADAAMKQLEAEALKARQQAAVVEAQISAALSAAIRNSSNGIYGKGPNVGSRVNQGDFVGIQGATGNSYGSCTNRVQNGGCGAHVHMEVRVGDVPVNPGPYLNGGTVKAPMTDYVITQGFGVTPFSSIYAGGRHTGYDMAGPDGSRVSSPVSGTVIMNEAFGGYGHAWAVQMDNGLVILLAHLR